MHSLEPRVWGNNDIHNCQYYRKPCSDSHKYHYYPTFWVNKNEHKAMKSSGLAGASDAGLVLMLVAVYPSSFGPLTMYM